jgi:tRNA dimethylallyltransferase
MLAEVKKLRQDGISWIRLEDFGLEYRYAAMFLQKKITREEMIRLIQAESEHYVKRQLTWFKRNKNVQWIKTPREAKKLAGEYLAD